MGIGEGREGQQLGNYRLLRLLGRGGFGEVYLGEHLYLQTPVAIKVLASQTEQQVRDLIRTEARTHARLDHPHIARLLDFGFEQDTPYLVMTYAPGGTLRTRHPRGTGLSRRQIVFYVQQIASALQYAHDQKVVHRDVKPENVLLGLGNTLLLSDFGIAVVAHQTHSLSEQEALGTIAYMAPEQAQGRARPASDQYALAVMAYEWLSGHLPFDGRSTAELVLQHLSEPPPPLIWPKASKADEKGFALFEQAIMRALAKDPRERFPSVLAFAQALERVCQTTEPAHPGTIITSFRGHLDFVGAIAWSPNSKQIASGSYDSTVRVWSAESGQTTVTFLGHTDGVNSVAWSPDGRSIASSSEDQTVRVWDAQTGRQTLLYTGHSDPVDLVAWSPDGTRIASADRCTVQIWNATTGASYLTYRGHIQERAHEYMMFGLAWSPSGFYLASGSEDKTIQVWDAATGKLRARYQGANSGLVWTRDGTGILFIDLTSAHLWDIETGKIRVTYHAHQLLADLALSPDSKYVAFSSQSHAVQIWELVAGTMKATYPIHTESVYRLAWSPDGVRFVTASEREVYVWQGPKLRKV